MKTGNKVGVWDEMGCISHQCMDRLVAALISHQWVTPLSSQPTPGTSCWLSALQSLRNSAQWYSEPLGTIGCLLQPHLCWSCSDPAVSPAGLCLQLWQRSLHLVFLEHPGVTGMKDHLFFLPNKFCWVSNKSTTKMLRAIFSAFSQCLWKQEQRILWRKRNSTWNHH